MLNRAYEPASDTFTPQRNFTLSFATDFLSRISATARLFEAGHPHIELPIRTADRRATLTICTGSVLPRQSLVSQIQRNGVESVVDVLRNRVFRAESDCEVDMTSEETSALLHEHPQGGRPRMRPEIAALVQRADATLQSGRGAVLPTVAEMPTSAGDNFDFVTWLVMKTPEIG